MRSVQLDGFAWVMSLIAAKQYSISCAGGIGLLVHCSHVPFIVRSGGIHGRRGLNDDLITDARCHVENRPSPILSCFNCRNMNMDERAWTSLAGDPKVREHSFRSGRPANDGREHCDRGNQYGCSAFRQRLGADGMEQTMSARANPNPINPRSALASTD